jgi:hypothetical protein
LICYFIKIKENESFVDHVASLLGVIVHFFGLEPKRNFVLGRFDTVGSVAKVSADINAEITADGSGGGVKRLGLTQHLAASDNGVKAFPDHADDGAHLHVFDELGEERLLGQVGIMLFQEFLGGGVEFQGNKFESLVFKSLNNLSD